MTLFVPGVGDVPIRWMPASDEDFKDKSEGARNGQHIKAIVYHRGVLNTLGALDSTFAHGDADPKTVGSPGRPVSAHFGIGDIATGVAITQYVDLSDTAYCNGDCRALTHPDQPSNWDKWYGHHHHNERTVSIEHDDNGGLKDGDPRKGIVTDYIQAVSIELTRLLLSGDIAAMRKAGIHVREQGTVNDLHALVPGPKTLIRHYDIAGANKPYCWRPWAADKVGFPLSKYVAALKAAAPAPPPASTEDDMPALITPPILGYTATVKPGKAVRTAPSLKATLIRSTGSKGETWTNVLGFVKGDVDPDDGSNLWLVRSNNGVYEYTTHANLASQPVDPTPFAQADIDKAVAPLKAALDSAVAQATSLQAKVDKVKAAVL